MIEEILYNLKQVNELRRSKNELVFTSQFIMEHQKLVALIKAITGMTNDEIELKTNCSGHKS